VFSLEVCSFRNIFGLTDMTREAWPEMRGKGVMKGNWFESMGRNGKKAALNQGHTVLQCHFVPRKIRSSSLFHISPVKVEALYFSETWVSAHETTRCHNPEDHNLCFYLFIIHLTTLSVTHTIARSVDKLDGSD
jgi:hypothetical protein